MALPKIGFNEGSLLRRTLLHVGTFVLGSVAFIGLMSFILVSIAKGLVAPPAAEAPSEEADTPSAAGTAGARTPKAPIPGNKGPARLKRPMPGAAAQPAKED